MLFTPAQRIKLQVLLEETNTKLAELRRRRLAILAALEKKKDLHKHEALLAKIHQTISYADRRTGRKT